MVEEGGDEVRAAVAEVDVVGMLPHVDGQQGLVGGGQRGLTVGSVDNVHVAVGLFHQPGPARAEVADGGFVKGFLERSVAAPFGVDGRSQRALGFTAAARFQTVPEEGVVPHLGAVVEQAAAGFFDDVFQRHVIELGALDQVVGVIDISLMVLAVVVFQRFARHMRGERVGGKGQGGEFVLHGLLLE